MHAQFDFTKGDSYCDNISGKTLIILRLLGFFLCYGTIYLSRPVRIYRLFKKIFQKKFLPDNLFEQRIYEFYLRHQQKRQQKKLVENTY